MIYANITLFSIIAVITFLLKFLIVPLIIKTNIKKYPLSNYSEDSLIKQFTTPDKRAAFLYEPKASNNIKSYLIVKAPKYNLLKIDLINLKAGNTIKINCYDENKKLISTKLLTGKFIDPPITKLTKKTAYVNVEVVEQEVKNFKRVNPITKALIDALLVLSLTSLILNLMSTVYFKHRYFDFINTQIGILFVISLIISVAYFILMIKYYKNKETT